MCFSWEETFCWMKQGRFSFLTRLKTLWTGRLWRTSCRRWTRRHVETRWAGVGLVRLAAFHQHWHHRRRAALWLTLMTSRLTFMTSWRDVTDAKLCGKRRLLCFVVPVLQRQRLEISSMTGIQCYSFILHHKCHIKTY